jgi:hypothetical protein
MPHEQLDPLSADILVGAAAIAEYIGIDERSARYQIDAGNIPVTRMGRLILSTKSVLRRRFTPEEAV